ncbi:LSMD1 domain-containing protein [Phanerochaete sordida]|uniref:LSMD1 domain-containing protein n=1 Tax=Phanerochaete sordida TaxID=48140 RepID=A0A9P3FWJ9_9APHY|nr:LSMD1 domain-containing protein [Phanerochaete sordida]
MLSTAEATAAASSTLPERIDVSLKLDADTGDTPAVARLKGLLNHTLRVTIRDGRVFLGSFAGTDALLNILLVNTDEFRFAPPQHANPGGRFVGLVLVPWRLVLSVEAQNSRGRTVDVDPAVGLRGIVETYEDADDGLYT